MKRARAAVLGAWLLLALPSPEAKAQEPAADEGPVIERIEVLNNQYLQREKVDFAAPANTTRTRQAAIPIAPANGACNGGGSCIPQPGTGQTVSSLVDRLMFRAAYRNFVDHESLVVSHSDDPSVSGVASGVRWYDFRLSGSPDGVCATFPCVRQQGTVADVANGRSRWMPSAMDTAENVLVGYSTTGVANGSDNHSIRFTGRSKDDPLGAMTVAETTIVTGTANNTNSRSGCRSAAVRCAWGESLREGWGHESIAALPPRAARPSSCSMARHPLGAAPLSRSFRLPTSSADGALKTLDGTRKQQGRRVAS